MFLGCNFEKTIVLHGINCQNAKFRKKTKTLKFGPKMLNLYNFVLQVSIKIWTKIVLFWYFKAEI